MIPSPKHSATTQLVLPTIATNPLMTASARIATQIVLQVAEHMRGVVGVGVEVDVVAEAIVMIDILVARPSKNFPSVWFLSLS